MTDEEERIKRAVIYRRFTALEPLEKLAVGVILTHVLEEAYR